MAEQEFYPILTKTGKEKEMACLDGQTEFDIWEIAVGDGNGALYEPDENQTSLKNECWRGLVAKCENEDDTRYAIVHIPADIGGFTIREIGAFDKSGNLLIVAKCAETVKRLPETGDIKQLSIRLDLSVINELVLPFLIDPSINTATVEYCDKHYQNLNQKAQPEGYAPLDETALLPDTHLPDVKHQLVTPFPQKAYVQADYPKEYAHIISQAHSTFDLAKVNTSGSPQISTDGILSYPDKTNFVRTIEQFDFSDAKSWSITYPIKKVRNLNEHFQLTSINTSDDTYLNTINISIQEAGKLTIGVWSTPSVAAAGRIFAVDSENPLTNNIKLYIRVSYDSVTGYKVELAENNRENFVTLYTNASTTIANCQGYLYIGRNNKNVTGQSPVEIYLSELEVIIDDKIFALNKTGVDINNNYRQGSISRLGTNENIKLIEKDNYITNILLSDYSTGCIFARLSDGGNLVDLNNTPPDVSFPTPTQKFKISGCVLFTSKPTFLCRMIREDAYGRFNVQFSPAGGIMANINDASLTNYTADDVPLNTKIYWTLKCDISTKKVKFTTKVNETIISNEKIANSTELTNNSKYQINWGTDSSSIIESDVMRIYPGDYFVEIDGRVLFAGGAYVPYTETKDGSKIVDIAYKKQVQYMYEQTGQALYLTLDEEAQKFFLPMVNIVGLISQNKKDVQRNKIDIDKNKTELISQSSVIDQINDDISDLDSAKADKTAVVHISGNQTIKDTKTFEKPIVGSLQGNSDTSTVLKYLGEAVFPAQGTTDVPDGIPFGLSFFRGVHSTPNTPSPFGHLLNMRSISNANTQLFFSWSTDDNTHSIYYRSHKETGDDAQWTPWRQLAFTDDTVARATADANGANIADTYLKKTDKDTLINYNMPNYKRRVDFNKDADFSAPGAGLVVVRMLLSNNKDYTVTVDGVGVVYEKLTDVNNVLQSTFLVKKGSIVRVSGSGTAQMLTFFYCDGV